MIRKGTVTDIESWMTLVRRVSPVFPGLETEEAILEHQQTVLKFIRRGEAICADYKGKILGVLLYSMKHNMICCLAIDPDYRKRGIASGMLEQALNSLDKTKDIVVSTFRENDDKCPAPRALYAKFGFVPEELVEEFGYPSQIFRLHSK